MKDTILVSLFTSLTVCFVSHFVRIGRDIHNRRRFFSDFASSILDEIKKAEGNTLPVIYKDSVQRLRPEVMRVMQDIRRWQRSSFQTAWDKYCRENEAPLNMHYEVKSPGEAVGYMLPHFEEGRKRLENLLCDMIKRAG